MPNTGFHLNAGHAVSPRRSVLAKGREDIFVHKPLWILYYFCCHKEITISFFLFSACNQAGLGIAAIFGPQNPDIAGHINSMCNTLEIPHIEVRLEPERNSEQLPLFSMNVYPETRQLSRAYLELLKLFQWNKFCVMYGDQRGKIDMPVFQLIIIAGLA